MAASIEKETPKQSTTPEVKKTGKVKRKERKFKNEPTSVLLNENTDSIQAFDYVTARAKEFSSMLNAVQNKGGAKRTFQKLPRHMRRRAMSFNVKRLPHKLRAVASLELEGPSGSMKKPTRKKRRLPSSYNKEYLSRQKEKAWLETHLWHAKRMRMETVWGHKLPVESYSKGVRVNYRFMNKGALLSDISYYSCLEISGNSQKLLVDALGPLFPAESAFHSPEILNGSKEGVVIMNSSTSLLLSEPIGPVSLLWQRPNTTDKEVGTVKLWVWCLPIILQQVKDTLNNILKEVRLVTHTTITDISSELLRFRLIGPQSLSVISSILIPPPPANNDCPSNEALTYLHNTSKWSELSKTSIERGWWVELMSHDFISKLREFHDMITEYVDEWSEGFAVSMVTPDPRLFLPKRKHCLSPAITNKKENKLEELLKLLNDNDEKKDNEKEIVEKNKVKDRKKPLPPNVNSPGVSFLWDSSVRKSVSTSKLPDHIINEIRSQFFLRQESINLGNETSHIPVTIIKKSYTRLHSTAPISTSLKPHPLVSGWDLIVPSNWGMSFWMNLIYRGTRPLSHNDVIKCCNIECLAPVFPRDFPDTKAGQEVIAKTQSKGFIQYGRYPPDKRQNFGKLRISSPYSPSWGELLATPPPLKEGDTQPCSKRLKSDNVVSILRTPSLLQTLRQFQTNLLSLPNISLNSAYLDAVTRNGIDQLLSDHPCCLVTVCCEIATHGTINAHSSLSLPSLDDLLAFKLNKSFKGPVEPLAPRGVIFCEKGVVYTGEYTMTRKEMKDIKKKRKKILSKKSDAVLTEEEKALQTDTPDKIFKLIPPPPSRTVIGYIGETVGYRHNSSRYIGIGHLSLDWWVELCRVCYQAGIEGVVCLCRGHTQQYQLVNVVLYEWTIV